METRICNACKEELPLTKEYFENKGNGRLRGTCKKCRKEAREKYLKENEKEFSNLTKVCSKCSRELPATTEYFEKHYKGKYGLHSCCIDCRSEYRTEYNKNYHIKHYIHKGRIKLSEKELIKRRKEWNKIYYENNKGKYIEYGKEYYQNNKEKVIIYSKNYYNENREKIIENSKLYYDKNKDRLLEYGKNYYKENYEYFDVYRKIYYENNKERYLHYRRQYYYLNKEYFVEYQKKWRNENKEKCKILIEKRRSLKEGLPSTLTLEQWEQIKKDFNYECAYCGMTEEEHIEKFGQHLHQEHLIALSKGGEYTLNNIIPACKSCNSSKHSQDFFEWYPQQTSYNKKRERFILNYLNYDKENKTQQLALDSAFFIAI